MTIFVSSQSHKNATRYIQAHLEEDSKTTFQTGNLKSTPSKRKPSFFSQARDPSLDKLHNIPWSATVKYLGVLLERRNHLGTRDKQKSKLALLNPQKIITAILYKQQT